MATTVYQNQFMRDLDKKYTVIFLYGSASYSCAQFSHTLLLQPLQWCCVDCVIHHERDVREEQKYICVAQARNNKRDCDARSLLLLAAAVRSFAHMPLGISYHNTLMEMFKSNEC